MNLMLFLSRGMMQLAAKLAPPSRNGWKAAMQGEFAAIQEEGRALSWSAGCLGAALGWRIARETPFMAAVILASAVAYLAYMALFWMTDYAVGDSLSLMMWRQQACIAAVCLICSLAWPRRAAFIALAIPLSFGGGAFLQFVWNDVLTPRAAYPGYHAGSAWYSAFSAVVGEVWPGAAGALAGVFIARAWRRAAMSRRSGAGLP